MSRRKQSNPRQFKRVFGQTDGGLEACEENELLKEENASTEEDPTFSSDPETVCSKDEDSGKKAEAAGNQEVGQGDSEGQDEKADSNPLVEEKWDGPRELEILNDRAEKGVRSRQALPLGTTWGPFPGKLDPASGANDTIPLVVSGGPQWLRDITWVSAEDPKNNCMVYSKGGHVWCSTTRSVMEGEELAACAVDVCSQLQTAGPAPHTQGMYPARLLEGLQLLPQQAAMASILPNAIVNKDIFPCKTCGIWFRSERNLQAHLMYYCSGRQRDPEIVTEKQTNAGHQMPRICTYPQCNMSFMGSHALEMHLSTHTAFKTEEPSAGSSLKCTICDHTADTLVTLQHHILSHLSQTGLRCSQCHFTFQTPRELSKHQELHRHNGTSGKPTKDDETDQPQSFSTESPKHGRREVNRKDTLESPARRETSQSTAQENVEQLATKVEASSGNRASFSYTRVKSEPSSPRLASSPIQHHMSPAFPMPPFMPHVPFSQDITTVPQASEILAKMSELVHRRLRHGGSAYPPVMYSTLVPKGATCFECNITFNNLDNYLVHKKHYCNSRWQPMVKPHDYTGITLLDKAADPLSPKNGGSLASMLNVGHSSEVKGQDSTQFNPSMCDLFNSGGKVPEEFPVQVKKALTPSGAEEKPNSIHLDSKSPKISPAENEMDPSQTTCEACKITFSRHETYMVHKQYYCASRHDPPAKRANKSPANQKAVRARKRRKAYEMPGPDHEQMQAVGPMSYLGMPSISGHFISQDAMESFKDQFHQRYNMIQGLVPKHPEPSLTVTKSALVSKCNAIAQEEGDVPIDLSKKCMPQFDKMPLPPKGLMDYHECVVCKLSFNKVEDYLTHKQNFCPGTALDNKVSGIKKEGSRSANNITEKFNKKEDFVHPVPNASIALAHEVTTSDNRTSAEEQQIHIADERRMQSLEGYPGTAKKMKLDEQIWPYYEIKPTDYATGMLVTQSERRQSPNEGSEGEKDQPMPDGSHLSTEDAEGLKIKNTGQTLLLPLPLNNSLEPEDKSLEPEKEPQSISIPDIHSTSSSPDPEGVTKPKESNPSSPATKTDEISPSIKRGLNGPIATAGNVKYCRPCDIQFNNLSNFITHKKFYCSAHTTEHVK